MKTTTMPEEQGNILTLCQGLTEEEITLVLQKILEIKSRRKNKTA